MFLSSRMTKKQRTKWQSVALPSSSNSSAKLKRRDSANNNKKPMLSSNATRPGTFSIHALTN